MQSVISDHTLKYLCNAQLTTGTSVKSNTSSKDSSKGSSEKESLALLQNEPRAKWNIKLLESYQKLDVSCPENSDVSISKEVLRGLDTSGKIKITYTKFVNRHITLYMISPIQNFDQNNIQEKLLAKAPSSPLLDSQIDPPQIDQKPCIETFPINLNSIMNIQKILILENHS